MAELAIWMLVVFGVLAVVVRVAIQVIRTGRTGLIGVRRGVGPLGWLAAVLFNGGVALGVLSVVDVHRGSLDTIDSVDVGALHVIGDRPGGGRRPHPLPCAAGHGRVLEGRGQ